jgi:hypothetical protein
MTIALTILAAVFLLVNIWQITRIFHDLSAGILGSVADAAAL